MDKKLLENAKIDTLSVFPTMCEYVRHLDSSIHQSIFIEKSKAVKWRQYTKIPFPFSTYVEQYCGFINFSLQPGEAVSEKVLKSYCWMYSTFNIPRDFQGQCARKNQSNNPMYNSYYQWVSLFLIFQAFLFYFPRIIWLMSEGGNCEIIKLELQLSICLLSYCNYRINEIPG